MLSRRQLKLGFRAVANQESAVADLNDLVKDIDRCERTISSLKDELTMVNSKYQSRTTTREDIDYLTALLECAKKKLVWEKSMMSLQKRAPAILREISDLLNDPLNPPGEELRSHIMQALQAVQTAMERLQAAKVG